MIDMHVHFFPPAVFQAIWRFFETKSNGLWTIRYKKHGADHVAALQACGVERFTTLVYAHKKGLAKRLNDFIAEWAAREKALIPFGTIYVGDGDVASSARRIFEDYRFYGIKLHPFVSDENIDDRRYFPAYEMMAAMGKVLVCHPGSAPVYGVADGAVRLRRILGEFPDLKVVAAHCGAFEYGEYAALADEFPQLYFDTAMNCIHHSVFHNNCPGPAFFQRYASRIVFGSDFPNIPYEYGEQVDAIRRFRLGAVVERDIFRENARRLLNLEESPEEARS